MLFKYYHNKTLNLQALIIQYIENTPFIDMNFHYSKIIDKLNYLSIQIE